MAAFKSLALDEEDLFIWRDEEEIEDLIWAVKLNLYRRTGLPDKQQGGIWRLHHRCGRPGDSVMRLHLERQRPQVGQRWPGAELAGLPRDSAASLLRRRRVSPGREPAPSGGRGALTLDELLAHLARHRPHHRLRLKVALEERKAEP